MAISQNPGFPSGTATTAPIYIDGSPLDEVNFYQISANSYHEQKKSERGFWATVPRRQADTTTEVYEVALASRQLVNTLTFSVARFPHRVRAQYQDQNGDWQDMRHSFGTKVEYAFNDSLPASISPTALDQGAPHPQHYGAGHWLKQKAVLLPFKTRRVRLLLNRAVGNPPRDAYNNPVAYSLGVLGFSLGYKVDAKSAIPKTRRHPTVVTEYDPFATGLDMFGSPISYATRENRASDMLRGQQWRSEPQPVPEAVVNLYVDARTETGEAPVVDRFYLEPTTLGVQLNLYYSNDESLGDSFEASDDLLDYPKSVPLGVLTPSADGLLFDDPNASVTFSNQAVQWHPSGDWWMGLVVAPRFAPSDLQERVLFDSALVRITITAGILSVQFGNTGVAQDLPFSLGDSIPMVISFIDGILHLNTNYGSASASDESLLAVATQTPVPEFRLGANLLDLVGSSNTLMSHMVLKEETVSDPSALFADFAATPDAYIVKADFAAEETGGSNNAILRYHPTFQTPGFDSVNPLGFLGGPGDKFAGKEWVPVSRDFRLAKGMLHFPPISAKFYKFEFTELVAEPYDTYSPVTKRVKVHPDWMKEPNKRSKKGGSRAKTAKGGLPTAVEIGARDNNYRDTRRVIGTGPRTGPSATGSMVSSDPSIAKRMRQISSYFNLVKWLPGSISNKWPKGKHFYKTVEIDHVHRVAYFVGLNTLEMHRLDYAVDDDSEQYIEYFHDNDNIAVQEWAIGENIASTTVAGSVLQSKVLHSKRKVRGIQFATVQSNPLQLIQDADFLDLTLANWAPYGDVAALEFSQELDSDLGSTVRVQRNGGVIGRSWDDTEAIIPNWNAAEAYSWEQIESDPNAINYGGIVGTQTVYTTPRGRVYAAARVFVESELEEPLYLQIVTPDNQVVAEESISPLPGQITEWYSGYTIGEGGETTGLTWDDAEAAYVDWDAAEVAGAWAQVSQETEILTSTLLPRIVQYGITQDFWDVDNISIFNDPIVWEFSNDGGATFYPVYDIRNNPDGAFVFPDADVLDPSPGFSTKLVWKATSYWPGSWVTSLVIRPWYTGLSLGIPHREAIQYGGPNHSPWDDYPEIHEDPHFMLWDLPVPQDWWFRFRRAILPTLIPGTPTPVTVLPEAIVVSPEEEVAQYVLNDPFVI